MVNFLSNEHLRSFLRQQLASLAQIENFRFFDFSKFSKILKNRKNRKNENFLFEPEKRVVVVETRATRRWNRKDTYFQVLITIKYVHTTGISRAHRWHTHN